MRKCGAAVGTFAIASIPSKTDAIVFRVERVGCYNWDKDRQVHTHVPGLFVLLASIDYLVN